MSLHYGLDRPTGDIDVVAVTPSYLKQWLIKIAGEGSLLHKKHKIYLQIVTVANLPHSFEERLRLVSTGQFTRLSLFIPDPIDLVLSKLTRNNDVDFEDAKFLARSTAFDIDLMEKRYLEELKPYVIGPVKWHDQTLRLWMEAIREQREKPPHAVEPRRRGR